MACTQLWGSLPSAGSVCSHVRCRTKVNPQILKMLSDYDMEYERAMFGNYTTLEPGRFNTDIFGHKFMIKNETAGKNVVGLTSGFEMTLALTQTTSRSTHVRERLSILGPTSQVFSRFMDGMQYFQKNENTYFFPTKSTSSNRSK